MLGSKSAQGGHRITRRGRALLGIACTAAAVAALSAGAGFAVVKSAPASADSSIMDAPSAPDETTALQIATQFGHSVIIDDEQTDQTIATAEADGTVQLSESSQPVQALIAGVWVPLDLTLGIDANGDVVSNVAAVPVKFSDGGSGPAVQVQGSGGAWESQWWTAGALPKPTLTGTSATYTDVFPGVNLVLSATATGMSEVLVITSETAAADPQLSSVDLMVSGTSLTPAADTGSAGSAQGATAATTGIGLATPSPTWWDSSGVGAGPGGPGGTNMPEPVPDMVSPQDISIDAATVAQTPDVVYPVYVDPAVTNTSSKSTYIDNAYPSQNYLNGNGASDNYVHVGYVDAGDSDDGKSHLAWGFWQVPMDGVNGTVVVSKAQLSTTEVYAYSCHKTQVDLSGGVGQDIDSSTTWSSHPSWDGQIAEQKAAFGYNSSCGYTENDVGFDVTGFVQNHNSAASLLFEMRADNESDPAGWKKFKSWVTLTITLDHPPTTPTDLAVSGCHTEFRGCGQDTPPAYVGESQPYLKAESTDPDSGSSITYNFSVYDYTTGDLITKSSDNTAYASGDLASWQVNEQLPDGNYYFVVTAVDGDGNASGQSDRFRFDIDTTPPARPSVVATGPLSQTASGFAGTVGVSQEKVTISEANASDHAYGYVYAITPSGVHPTIPTDIQCGSTANGFVEVCPGNIGDPVTVTVEAPDDTSTFIAATFDAAGNGFSSGSSQPFYANGDYTSAQAGHSWRTDTETSTSCVAASVSDAVESGVTAQDLSVSSGAPCSMKDSSAPAAGAGGSAALDASNGVRAYAGGGSDSTTSQILDTTQNFTVGGWVNLGNIDNGDYSFMSEDPGQDQQNSGFSLGVDDNRWRFCMSTPFAIFGAANCVTQGGTAPSGWTFVSGEFDAQDSMMMLRISTSGSPSTPAIDYFTAHGSVGGPLTIGRDVNQSAVGDYFVGHVLDPFAIQGVMDSAELQELANLVIPMNLKQPTEGT